MIDRVEALEAKVEKLELEAKQMKQLFRAQQECIEVLGTAVHLHQASLEALQDAKAAAVASGAPAVN